MARERNREKKICRGQRLVRKTSSSSDIQNAISTEINPIIEITHDHKTTRLESMSTDQTQNTGIKIPYNKRVEQVLRHDLSVFIKENINNKFSEVFDIQIPEFLLEVIITGSSKITVQNIADLFVIAMKVRQKEIYAENEGVMGLEPKEGNLDREGIVRHNLLGKGITQRIFKVVLDPKVVGDDDIGLRILDGCLLFSILDDVIFILATLKRYVSRNNKHFRDISFHIHDWKKNIIK
ncbi:107_t:CDS:2 [Funneliformis mosseae]|uniref:107_t:CDS:1 n=1 Tax=Funneliformis mosseae TaxID=27381 RepID=A0A9N9H0Q0_FUNMO|nr:107_t:CDS:2 [Funneliformis mosseae]